jgi:ribonuclease-3
MAIRVPRALTATNPMRTTDELQQRMGHRFRQAALLQRALTHRSFGADHNERLEFLGDAVLSLAVSSLLYDRFAGQRRR